MKTVTKKMQKKVVHKSKDATVMKNKIESDQESDY